jgi:hypothetical protein
VLAWLVVVVLTLPGILYPIFFPAGLFRIFGVPENEATDHPGRVIGWVIYFGLTVATCLSRRKVVYFVLYAILCILLSLNVVGCRAFWSDFREIH